MADEIVMYGADWCGDCRRAQRLLDGRGARYRYIDVEHDADAREEARRVGGDEQEREGESHEALSAEYRCSSPGP